MDTFSIVIYHISLAVRKNQMKKKIQKMIKHDKTKTADSERERKNKISW